MVKVDELSASLDGATEALLYEALRAHCERTGVTLLMVCHKLHGVGQLCDKVSRAALSYLFLLLMMACNGRDWSWRTAW